MNLLSALLRLRPRRRPRGRSPGASTDYADMGTAFGLDAMLAARGTPAPGSTAQSHPAARSGHEPTAPGALSSGA